MDESIGHPPEILEQLIYTQIGFKIFGKVTETPIVKLFGGMFKLNYVYLIFNP